MSPSKKEKVDLLLCAAQVVTPVAASGAPLRGQSMNQLRVISAGAVACNDGKICAVGEKQHLEAQYEARLTLAHPQSCITPGLIDCHTHLVFAGSRENDFYARLSGDSYEAISRRGGGIRESVRHLRQASKEELREKALQRLHGFLQSGTTTCEIKSGYGLSVADEIKTLEVIGDLQGSQPLSLVPTFLGAHEIPDEYRQNRQGYLALVCEQMIPQVAKRQLARFCDVFCEKDFFSIEESEFILKAARQHGLLLKLHADELAENFGGAELASRLQATSADHLVMIAPSGIAAMAKSSTIAVLLPATTFFLGKDRYAPARALLEAQVPLALATDLNPGSSNTENLQAVMTLAAIKLKMSPEEILTAVTHNAACALGEGERVGRLEAGLAADLVVWEVDDYRKIPYHFGGNRVRQVIKDGQKVCDRSAIWM